jgi:hypothetical protein
VKGGGLEEVVIGGGAEVAGAEGVTDGYGGVDSVPVHGVDEVRGACDGGPGVRVNGGEGGVRREPGSAVIPDGGREDMGVEVNYQVKIPLLLSPSTTKDLRPYERERMISGVVRTLGNSTVKGRRCKGGCF